MGSRPRTLQTDSHERNHDVHVRQQSTNLQHHDGIHALQGPHPGSNRYKRAILEIRDREQQGQDLGL